jgi:hypothetical protein
VKLRPVYRVTTFVPPEHLEALLAGITRAVPLRHGDYDSVAWWWAAGTEQFRPLPGSNPTHGRVGQTERVATVRLELSIPREPELLAKLLDEGLVPHHPWEEPAVFVDEAFAPAARPER